MKHRDGWIRRFPRGAAIGSIVVAAAVCGLLFLARTSGVKAGGPAENSEGYRVLAPIESGNLLLFPVVRGGGKADT